MTITPQHFTQAHHFMAAFEQTCTARKLHMPDIRDVLLAQRNGRTYAISIFPDTVGAKLEAYENADFLHQISTALKGVPVRYSNHTGFRLIATLDGYQTRPGRLDYPGHQSGQVRLGIDQAGREVSKPWNAVGHGLVVGMTGSGKTSTLRVIIADALADGCRLILGDLHDSTFPMLRDHPALLAPIGHSPVEYIELMQIIRGLKDQRQAQYAALHSRGVYPDDLDEYNAAVDPAQRLPRIVAVFDEFSTACDQDNGSKGELAHLTFQMATEVRKFGLSLIFAGQAINADLVGPMRDQITTRICFRVARREISRTVVFRPGAELILSPGHGLTLEGKLQAYYLDKAVMIDLARRGRSASNTASADWPVSAETAPARPRSVALRLTPDERRMVQAAQSAGGWFRIDDIADDTGIGRNTINAVARRLANDGYLTEVIYQAGKRQGRQITDRLIEAAGLGNHGGIP
jgi:hypothetical protein